MHTLAKNSKISDRGNVCAIVSSVLLSLACFRRCDFAKLLSRPDTSSSDKSAKKAKKPKKSSKQDDIPSSAETHRPAYEKDSIECMAALTQDGKADSEMFPEEISRLAGVKLLSLLAEVGSSTIDTLNMGIRPGNPGDKTKTKPSAPAEAEEKETETETTMKSETSSPTVLYYLVSLFTKAVKHYAEEKEESPLVLYNDDIDISVLKIILDGIYVLHKSSKSTSPAVEEVQVEMVANSVKKFQIMDSLTNLSSQCLLSAMCSQATQIEVRMCVRLAL